MSSDQRRKTIEDRLIPLGMTIKGWAKDQELDHRIVENLISGVLRGTHGISLSARKKMEAFFGSIFES